MGKRDRKPRGLWLAGAILFSFPAFGQPKVQNPSFEKDHFGKYPGYAAGNGGEIRGRSFVGHVGINPWWQDGRTQTGPTHNFSDNGRIPHGRQVAFLQNAARLSQRIGGFKKGRKYHVVYYENARRLNWTSRKPPRITVTLGGETVVSLHPVAPVEALNTRELPFDQVRSAIFIPPADGTYELVFATTVNNRVTVLIDNVVIKEIEERVHGKK